MSGGNAGNGWARRTIAMRLGVERADDRTILRGGCASTWPPRLSVKAQTCHALLAGSLRARRILLEALQMRGDQLVVGGDRRRATRRC